MFRGQDKVRKSIKGWVVQQIAYTIVYRQMATGTSVGML
jgi:hypothetical protein